MTLLLFKKGLGLLDLPAIAKWLGARHAAPITKTSAEDGKDPALESIRVPRTHVVIPIIHVDGDLIPDGSTHQIAHALGGVLDMLNQDDLVV
eukprot:CAMPEP_0170577278 /NCGR_PEP_ID=MMETSP0224-20130122/4841_1 /TAXON_ID=285029 /ORGANISM="Togula jolla, Strain CCCM 725" /LENGTH=91 /DNA_ID=CAMNT_0010900177 /DNA_START=214 /DNA_END=490 /DNA_ORIENTATION=-